MSSSGSSVPKGHVELVLLSEGDSEFYLQIPLDIISSLCLTPRKYLLFLGWCILGVEGVLALEHDGDRIDTDGDLDDQEVYHYVPVAGLDLVHAVDLEVIKLRTDVPSESTQTRDEFCNNLLERDVCCVWTGVGRAFGTGLHIVPYKQDWFRLIVENRPNYSENVTALGDINDIRNGVFANTLIHNGFGPRFAAVLKTPNPILKTKDIPPRHIRRHISEDVSFPSRSRYTLQWLVDPGEDVTSMIPNNSDAAFRKNTRKSKPSDLLLHYNYGAAALKCWGRGLEVLQNSANPPRPPVPVPAPTGPSRTKHDRKPVIRKLRAARDPGGAVAGSSTAGAGTGESVESEGQAMWDEDDAILFFWGNSQAAKERHLKKIIENTRRMEQWRGGVPQVSV
ncbi:hypothetical protein M378DRAFT_87561 [Amanita muscaria Koide BX008]|uniref:HNH nuclease domain-containing protein n=1 Tax=Amanita muscaria (strain Koide BX008) TaxID=946122 RepID=A0A0C2SUE9_AMAMK|nr:hypothetical protein M378DRAFT_87561 [Amanita muscaria Koide BX008]